MEFRETLLAAQRNQQHKSSESSYYKARFDPPKKEQKQRDKLSANIQKFLAKKDEEEKQKQLDTQRKRDELLAMRDPKALRKIQKTLKTIKSANKSVLEDAIDRDNTAVTLNGPEQPDQDDYGYESQESAAIYAKMMQKYSKIPEQPKFPTSNSTVKKDLLGTKERVKQALQHADEPVPHKRRRRTNAENNGYGRDESPPSKYEPEKREDKKPDKPKPRKPMPPPIDFNQLLKLAEQKKSEPLEVQQKKTTAEPKDAERLMTKRQKREYEEEMARRQRRQERLDAEKNGGRKPQKEDKPVEKEKRTEPSGFGRIPKLNDKSADRNNSPRPSDREKAEKLQREKDRARQEREKIDKERNRLDREKLDKDKADKDKLDKLKAERERIERDIERLNKDRERLEKTKSKLENKTDRFVDKTKTSETTKKNIDLKSQNTYRIDKNSNDKKLGSKNNDRYPNGSSSDKSVSKLNRDQQMKNDLKGAPVRRDPYADRKPENGKRLPDNGKRLPESKVPSKRPDDRMPGKQQAGSSKSQINNSFDFDKHVNSLKKGPANANGTRHLPPSGVKRKPHPDDKRKPNRRVVDSESDYDSEMDDFIDDGDVNTDYSKHIKEIFGYDKSRYRDMDDDDDPSMVSSFAQQQREEFISKKIGIMEDLEDMRMEAMEKKKSKKRRISDD